MCRSLPESGCRDAAARREDRGARRRSGLTLIELLIAMTITSMLSVVLGGLVLAVHTAREHCDGLQNATLQAAATIERIRFMVSHAGVYQLPGSPTVAGLKVVPRRWSYFDLPEILVVWSGGRYGGMAEAGLQNRLPKVNELVIYGPDPSATHQLVEIVLPNDVTEIDFGSNNFNAQILALMDSIAAQKTRLCDRIRVSQLSAFAGFSEAQPGNVRFELEWTPGDDVLSSAAPGTADWNGLMWSQGIVGSDFGMRQGSLRIELQLCRSAEAAADPAAGAALSLPFFGSASYRYAYRP